MGIKIEGEAFSLLKGMVGVPSEMEGQVTSNLIYIGPLEYGHSGQAPEGMVGAFVPEYIQTLKNEVEKAIADNPGNMAEAVNQALAGATLAVTRAIADRTPVLTGRAKGSWVANLPDGSAVNINPEVSEEEQKALLKTTAIKEIIKERRKAQ